MFDIPTEPYHFEVIQDHSDYKMAIEKSSVQAKNLSLEGKEYPVIQAWIHTQYPEPYYEQVHHQTGKNKLVFSQWYLSYFSCADKANAIVTMKFYGRDGKLINESMSRIDSLNDFSKIRAETVGEIQLNTVCRLFEKQAGSQK